MIGLNGNGEKALLDLSIPSLTTFITAYNTPHRSFKMVDANFEKLMQFPIGGKGQGCLIDRWMLHAMLQEGIGGEGEEEVKIEWGKRFERYEETENGVVAYFEDGTKAEGDILVGADGARSRVRQQRTNQIVYPLILTLFYFILLYFTLFYFILLYFTD